MPEALKGGIELRGGALYITGAVKIPGQGYFAEEAADGKIAMTDFGANFSANGLTVTGSEISLPVGGTLTAHNLNLDQNVTSNTTLHIRSVGEDASLDVVNGNGGNISYTGFNKPEGVQDAISAEAPTSATVASDRDCL